MKMKRLIFAALFAALIMVSGSVEAQNQSTQSTTMKTASVEKKSHEYTFKIDSAKLATKKPQPSSNTNGKTVAYYDYFIDALETKRDFVMNNPEEKARAEESGWFEKIDTELKKAKAEREELLQK